MEIKPKSREEIAREKLLKPGIYDGEVMRAEETTSKSSGNPMIKLKVRIFHDGGEAHLYDYITSTQVEKLCAFCDAVGLSKEYDAGDVNSDDMEGRPFRAKIGIEDEKPKEDVEGNWPAKNKIKDYLPRNEKDGGRKPKEEDAPAVSTDKEELPF